MFKIGDKIWMVDETDLGHQVNQYVIDRIVESPNGVYGSIYYVIGKHDGYERWQLHEYQEDAINEICDIKVAREFREEV